MIATGGSKYLIPLLYDAFIVLEQGTPDNRSLAFRAKSHLVQQLQKHFESRKVYFTQNTLVFQTCSLLLHTSLALVLIYYRNICNIAEKPKLITLHQTENYSSIYFSNIHCTKRKVSDCVS
jgi:hypothetical protein